jgi:hypothetical protein
MLRARADASIKRYRAIMMYVSNDFTFQRNAELPEQNAETESAICSI